MCNTQQFMYLTLLISNPKVLKKGIDVNLRPLIDELNVLWNDSIKMFDYFMKHNFTMRVVFIDNLIFSCLYNVV